MRASKTINAVAFSLCAPLVIMLSCKSGFKPSASGAQLIEFHVDGNTKKARGYYKSKEGTTIDQFNIIKF